MYSVPAYFNGAVYYLRTGEYLKRVSIANAHLDDVHTTANDAGHFGFPGASPSISADGSRNGIVWVTEAYDPAGNNMKDHSSPGHLRVHAYDALTLAELFNSGDTAPLVDGTPYRNFMKFVPPTITNGHVYVASGGQIQVYGLKTPTVPADVTASVKVTLLPTHVLVQLGQDVQAVTLTNTSSKPLAGPVSLGKSVTIRLTFSVPAGSAGVTYRPRVLAGPGAR